MCHLEVSHLSFLEFESFQDLIMEYVYLSWRLIADISILCLRTSTLGDDSYLLRSFFMVSCPT